jgi:two-component system phosphate regulon response regulator OmpR
MVVDDDPSIQRAVGRMLALEGFIPVEALTVDDAKRGVARHRLGAIVLDLLLPNGESGLDFLAWLREQPPHVSTPVLILTGQSTLSEDDRDMIRRHGASVFFKPQPLTALIEELSRLTQS